jgi:GMP synthase PP-ATPase subunit
LVDNAFSQAIYTRNYEIINAANTVIENTSKVTDPENKKRWQQKQLFKVACLF